MAKRDQPRLRPPIRFGDEQEVMRNSDVVWAEEIIKSSKKYSAVNYAMAQRVMRIWEVQKRRENRGK